MADPASSKTALDRVQQVAQIIALLAVPILVAASGWVVQGRSTESSTRQEYVKLAVSILNSPGNPEQIPLRNWAVQLLNHYSVIKFDPQTQQALGTGKLSFPDPQGIFPPVELAVSYKPTPPHVGQSLIFLAKPSGGTGYYNYSWATLTEKEGELNPLNSDTNKCKITFETPGTWRVMARVISNGEKVEEIVEVNVLP